MDSTTTEKLYDLYSYFVFKTREKYFDDGNVNYFFDKYLFLNNSQYRVSLIYEDAQIIMARICKSGLKEKFIPTKIQSDITILKEHLLTSINIHFDPYARIRFNMHQFIEEGGKPDINILLDDGTKKKNQISANEFSDIFLDTFDYGNELKLLSDAQKTYVPVQFRYLSLYKWLELEFKTKGRWNNSFISFTDQVEDEFQKRNFSKKKFSNYLHDIRDKCAHIKSNSDALGVTSLSYEDEKKVIEFTKFLSIVCIEYFNQIKLKDKSCKVNFFAQQNIDLA